MRKSAAARRHHITRYNARLKVRNVTNRRPQPLRRQQRVIKEESGVAAIVARILRPHERLRGAGPVRHRRLTQNGRLLRGARARPPKAGAVEELVKGVSDNVICLVSGHHPPQLQHAKVDADDQRPALGVVGARDTPRENVPPERLSVAVILGERHGGDDDGEIVAAVPEG